MISQWSADGRETRYDPRQMTRWPEMDTAELECWHGPTSVYDGGSLLIKEGRGTVYLTRNEASWCNAWREGAKAAKSLAERSASVLRGIANRFDEVPSCAS